MEWPEFEARMADYGPFYGSLAIMPKGYDGPTETVGLEMPRGENEGIAECDARIVELAKRLSAYRPLVDKLSFLLNNALIPSVGSLDEIHAVCEGFREARALLKSLGEDV